MNLDAAPATLLVEGRAGAAFVLWLCLGIAVAAGAGLLFPWPPAAGAASMAAVVLFVCGAAAWTVGRQREVGFDPAARTVIERVTVAGWARERRVVLAADARVEVTKKIVKVARSGTDVGHRTSSDYDHRPHFRLALRSGAVTVSLDVAPDVLSAERRAREIAEICRVPAVRNGYGVAIEFAAGEGAAASSTRRVVTVRDVPGGQSAIDASSP